MAFKINYDDLVKMETLNRGGQNGELFIDKNMLIKVSENDVNKMIKYLISIPEHPHVVKPLEHGKIIYSSKNVYTPIYKSAYKMPFLPDAKPLSFLAQFCDIPYEEKVEYIKQLFSALQFLHQYLVIGDIHANNLIVSNGKVYIIDLDDAKKKGKSKAINCLYYVDPFEWINASIYTDVTKLYLESLSFILEISFQNYIGNYGYRYFWNILTSCHLPKEVMEFLLLCKHPHHLKTLGQDAYRFENFIHPSILKNEKKLKLTLQCL